MAGPCLDDSANITVRRRGSGIRAANLTVSIGEEQATTDARGKFGLAAECRDQPVTLTGEGYRPHTGPISDDVVWVVYNDWYEVVVYEQPKTTPTAQQYSAEELRRTPGAAGDPLRALQSTPSIARPRTVEGTLAVRGAEGEATRAYVDGVPLPFLYHFFLGKSVVDASMVQSIELQPSAPDLSFGDVAQATIDVRTRRAPAHSGFHGDAHIDPLEVGVAGVAPLGGNTDLQLAGRTSWLGMISGVGEAGLSAVSGDRVRESTKFPYSDLTVSLGSGPKNSRFITRFQHAGDRLETVRREDGAVVSRRRLLSRRFDMASLQWSGNSANASGNVWFNLSREDQLNRMPGVGSVSGQPQRARQRGDIAQLHAAGATHLTEALELTGGVDARARHGRSFTLDQAPRVASFTDTWASGFVRPRLTLGAVEIDGGVRASYYGVDGERSTTVEPRAQVSVRWSEGVQTVLQGRRGAQLIDAFRRHQYPKSSSPLVMADTIALTQRVKVGGTQLEVSAYGARFENTPVRRPQPYVNAFGYLSYEPRFLTTDGRSYGIEASARLDPLSQWFGWIGGSIGRSERRVDGEWRPADQDGGYRLNAMIGRKLPRGWTVSARGTLGAGYPITEREPVYLSSEDRYGYVYGEHNALRLAPYHRFDVRIDHEWVLRRSKMKVYLDIFNVTNARVPLSTQFTYDYSALRTQMWIPILPVLGAEWEF